MTVNLSCIAGAGWQFFNSNGAPLSGGLLYTYQAGTTTPAATYTTNSGLIQNSNPIQLDAAGRVPEEIWLVETYSYKFVLRDASDVIIWTKDNIYGIADAAVLNGFIADLANTTNSTKGDALVGFRQSNSSGNLTGAIGRTVHQKLQESVSILDFGADPTGVADSTAAIQAALTAVGANGTIKFPAGTYLVSSTLNAYANQQLIGGGYNETILYRTGNYGDTLYFSNAGAATIKGIWFKHSSLPASGFTSLANLATTGAHLHFGNGQAATIEDCWFWRMPIQVKIDQGSLIRINRCHMQGCWNLWHTAGQEGVAGVYIGATNYCVLIEITSCYFGGSDAGAQSVNFVISDNGTQTVNFSNSNAGNQYGIYVQACEGLVVDNSYIGGNAYSNILFAPTGICNGLRITNNFVDGAGYNSPCFYFAPSSNGYYATNVTIEGNTFNGQLYAFQAIGSSNPVGTQPAIAGFTIVGNTFQNGLGSAIFLSRAQDGVIGNNSIASYNSRNLTPGGDVNYCNAVYLTNCISVTVDGNIIGGNINSGYPGGYTYRGIDFGGTLLNVIERNTVHNGTGTSVNIVGKVDKYIVVADNVDYTCTGAEDLVVCNTSTSAISVNLPYHAPSGYTVTVKDIGGNATTRAIAVIGTIDNTVNYIIGTDYASATFTLYGTAWYVTAAYKE